MGLIIDLSMVYPLSFLQAYEAVSLFPEGFNDPGQGP